MNTARALVFLLLSVAAPLAVPGIQAAPLIFRDNDDLPIPEPEEDDEGAHLWWDAFWSTVIHPAERVLDLGSSTRRIAEWLELAEPEEARNVNSLDEVPDSTWFTNRHGSRRLSPVALARGPNLGRPPAERLLEVLSGKSSGSSPGLVMRDTRGERYLVKFDSREFPEVATGAELVTSKILHALGWNVPEYHLVALDPRRLRVAEHAWIETRYGGKRPMRDRDLEAILAPAARRPGGKIRISASRFVPGRPKGSFKTVGTRSDDPNDTVPHEHRRELRALVVINAWLNNTDTRRGNFHDSFVTRADDARGRGHLVHYLLDFSSSLGAKNLAWKERWHGHEYAFDPTLPVLRILSLGLWRPAWASLPVTHPLLGYFESSTFDPEEWRATYPSPLFAHATVRDVFWGAKLVSSIEDADLRVVVGAGEWSDPAAADLLFRVLRERRERIARAYFDVGRVNPADRFRVGRSRLRFRDLAIDAGTAARDQARYRHRDSSGVWNITDRPELELPPAPAAELELQTSHDGGRTWSPSTRVEVASDGRRPRVVRVDRETD